MTPFPASTRPGRAQQAGRLDMAKECFAPMDANGKDHDRLPAERSSASAQAALSSSRGGSGGRE
jgi:hypothetical protein